MLPAFLFCDAVVCWVFFESLFLGSTLGGGENFPFFRLLGGPVCVWLALFDAALSIFGAGVEYINAQPPLPVLHVPELSGDAARAQGVYV